MVHDFQGTLITCFESIEGQKLSLTDHAKSVFETLRPATAASSMLHDLDVVLLQVRLRSHSCETLATEVIYSYKRV